MVDRGGKDHVRMRVNSEGLHRAEKPASEFSSFPADGYSPAQLHSGREKTDEKIGHNEINQEGPQIGRRRAWQVDDKWKVEDDCDEDGGGVYN